VYPKTGHALHWERPAEFVTDLQDFISEAYENMRPNNRMTRRSTDQAQVSNARGLVDCL